MRRRYSKKNKGGFIKQAFSLLRRHPKVTEFARDLALGTVESVQKKNAAAEKRASTVAQLNAQKKHPFVKRVGGRVRLRR